MPVYRVDISFINVGLHSVTFVGVDGSGAVEHFCPHLWKEGRTTPRLHTLNNIFFFHTLILRLLLRVRAS